mmetsp:Transcript_11753/g.30675  ORF Transcript_11753/g.30675 Transcript_11753/m.30675 type:complete len:219 (-) Transcript_11753:474-1130(-)
MLGDDAWESRRGKREVVAGVEEVEREGKLLLMLRSSTDDSNPKSADTDERVRNVASEARPSEAGSAGERVSEPSSPSGNCAANAASRCACAAASMSSRAPCALMRFCRATTPAESLSRTSSTPDASNSSRSSQPSGSPVTPSSSPVKPSARRARASSEPPITGIWLSTTTQWKDSPARMRSSACAPFSTCTYGIPSTSNVCSGRVSRTNGSSSACSKR